MDRFVAHFVNGDSVIFKATQSAVDELMRTNEYPLHEVQTTRGKELNLNKDNILYIERWR